MGGGVSTNHKSSNRTELSWFSQQFLNFYWFDLTPPINPLTHPQNNTPTHGWGSLHRFQIFKQNWNISITSSAIEFWLIPEVPPWGVGGGWMWVGVVRGCHPHTCTHTCIWHHREFPWIPPMGVAICMKLSCLPRVCACMRMHVHMCGDTPQPTSTLIHPPLPPLRAAGSQKHQNSISLELIEIIRFCLKILYLWTFLNSYRL